MVDFDLSITWQGVEKRLAETTNPRHRTMLETLIAHGKGEAACDANALMATLNDDPQYHFWGNGVDRGPKGFDAVRNYYIDFVRSGAAFFESSKARIVMDDDNIVTECEMRQLMPGSVALARGYQVPDPNGPYLTNLRTVIFWPFDEDARLVGEDSYGSSDNTSFEQIPEDQLPREYIAMLESIGKWPSS